MKTCKYCSAEFDDERPYDHCTDPACVKAWLRERRENLRVDLLPKQNFEIVDIRTREKTSGRASGK